MKTSKRNLAEKGSCRGLLAGIFAALLCMGVTGAMGAINPVSPSISNPARNVLLIIMDDVGVDQIQRYVDYYNNTTASTSDNMDINPPSTSSLTRIAQAGVTFVNAWASPTCSPTRAGLLTGTYPFRAINGVYLQGEELPSPSSTTTIAETLSGAGYVNALFGKWHLGATVYPTHQGWDRFYGSAGGAISGYYDWTKIESDSSLLPNVPQHQETLYATYENVDDAYSWIITQTKPWMATVAFNAAHWSGTENNHKYELPPHGCGGTVIGTMGPSGTITYSDLALFRGTIECMDQEIGQLLYSIRGVLDKTTIIVIGDNGTSTDMTSFVRFQDGRGKGSAYEGGLNVPFIIADGYAYNHNGATGTGTGRVVSPNRFSTALVQTVDIAATVAEIAGVNPASDEDSKSLISILKGIETPVRSEVFMVTDRPEAFGDVAIRGTGFALGASYKLIINYDEEGDSAMELYRLSMDRWEANDLMQGQGDCPSVLSSPPLLSSPSVSPSLSFDDCSSIVTSLCSRLSTLTAGNYSCP